MHFQMIRFTEIFWYYDTRGCRLLSQVFASFSKKTLHLFGSMHAYSPLQYDKNADLFVSPLLKRYSAVDHCACKFAFSISNMQSPMFCHLVSVPYPNTK